MSKTRIFWTNHEERLVFEQVPDAIVGTWPSMWKKVMEVLPPERRKSMHSSSTSTIIKGRYYDWLKENPDFKPGKVRLLNPVIPSKIEEPYLDQPPEIIVVEKVVKQEADYGRISTSTLARILLERLSLMDQFDRRFQEMEAMIQAKHLAENNHDLRLGPSPPPETKKEEAIRIAVIGPLDSQFREIEARLINTPKPVKLKLYDKDRNSNTQAIGIVDYAIVTRHCNHMWWDRMKQVLPADRVFFVDSGIQSVVQKVYDVCSRP